MDEDDIQAIQSFLVGDDEAFELLLKKYLKPVYNFLYQLVGDRSILDDLTQVIFIKAWKNIRRFDQNRSFKVWIFAIAKNTAYDYLKKKKTIPFSFFENADGASKLEEITDDKILPDEILERKNISRELEDKLKEIPKNYQLILVMHYKEEVSLQEIAEILNLPYNTVKSQHARALTALRKTFEGRSIKKN